MSLRWDQQMRHQYLGSLLTRGVLQMASTLQLAGHQGGLHLQWLLALLAGNRHGYGGSIRQPAALWSSWHEADLWSLLTLGHCRVCLIS